MLSDLAIRQAKPRERDYKLTDYDGLHLLVRPTGTKLWRLSYRFVGKQKLLALPPSGKTPRYFSIKSTVPLPDVNILFFS
jgi:hypothetical protein